MQTESDEINDPDEDYTGAGGDDTMINQRIHQRIKQLLGSGFNKIKTENGEGGICKPDKSKSGRGKWHYSSDQTYGFNVSYSNGDTIISMGQVFII